MQIVLDLRTDPFNIVLTWQLVHRLHINVPSAINDLQVLAVVRIPYSLGESDVAIATPLITLQGFTDLPLEYTLTFAHRLCYPIERSLHDEPLQDP